MADRHQRVKELFLQARELPQDEREAWLKGVCGGDASVRGEVESLLSAEREMGSDYLVPGSGVGLSPGSAVSHYRLVQRLGTGGMGEVWAAHDETLGRRVALKFPAEPRLGDSSVRRRLRREARAAAGLEHPAVCRVFELGQVDGQDFIAMEYLEGETLAARIARGPVPVKQALAWGAAIAGALEEAHDKGLVHRDLKPANVMVTPAGEVKVMDFGLALLLPARSQEDDVTLTAGLTAPGVIVGTPAYMAPEQLEGRPASERSDIWALGCLLFEMLTGERTFGGATRAQATAAILEHEPEWQRLPAEMPAEIRSLLARCLRKDPERRQRHVGDLRLALEDAVRGELPPGASPAVTTLPRPGWRRRLSTAAALVLLLLVALSALVWLRPRTSDSREPVRMTVTLPPGVRVTTGPGFGSTLAMSPDGRTLVIAGTGEDGERLYRRQLDRHEVTPVPDTEGGSSPFFSPDGRWIGFFADRRLRRVPVGGGAAVDIAAAPGFPSGASWGPDERVVYAFGGRSRLHVVSARGGNAEPLTALDLEGGETSQSAPEILPDGRTVLFRSGSWVHALDLVSGRRAALIPGASPRYATSGHVVLSRGSALLAAPFDPSRLEITGPVVPVVENVAVKTFSGVPHYAISRGGTLAYVPAASGYEVVLVKADGTERPVTEEGAAFENPQLSPDGRRLAVAARRREDEPTDVWIHDLETGVASRLTFDRGRAPVWTPDGEAVTYSRLGERQGIYVKPVDGRREAEQLLPIDEFHWLVGWTPDGRTLAYGVMEGVTEDGTSPSSIVASTGSESHRVVGPGDTWGGRLSPDGLWLAYYTGESGQFEVFLTPFPAGGSRWLISEGGGRDPSWAPDGTEVYYRSGDRLVAARIDTQDGIRVLSRRLVIEPFSPPLYDDYDIHPDGRTVVMVRPTGDAPGREVTMVLDWLTELRRLMP